jgi:hypothetical protein
VAVLLISRRAERVERYSREAKKRGRGEKDREKDKRAEAVGSYGRRVKSEGEDIEEKKRDIPKSSVIDQSEYPTNKSTYPAIQSRHMHPGISTDHQYSIHQRPSPEKRE